MKTQRLPAGKRRRRLFLLVIVGEMEVVQNVQEQSHGHAHDGSQTHSGQLDRSDLDIRAGESGDEDDRGQGKVAGTRVVDFFIHHEPDAGGRDHAVEQEAYAAHDRRRDGLNQTGRLADEGQTDREHRRASDDPDAVNLCDRHDADVLTVGRGRNGAAETGQRRGDSV